ncbi:TetR/AcrR family transcriptional regulator [Thioalkalivibrio paradoxus]|uniref:TetR family transcriptional regulator n=1 Tax=Thioalkalivibrio paradoxus ARh 1 TaxID=713585 RepID=W0DLG3_9GAMM|nr:TetR/AcrR family transcriptional regulator [Thioalkalivibrio paradoxus]AHE99439.1 TetR family transcriptional regulator [Thioalkalivibrio paradoxus ARh 1]
MASTTKQRLLDTGLAMLLKHGYHDLGIQALLEATHVPKGSFYHHFTNKEDFALQVIDEYMREVHEGLAASLGNPRLSPLQRARTFFELSRDKYRREGYMGCLLGGLGQELAGVSEGFRRRIQGCFAAIVDRLTACLEEAREQGEIDPQADPRELADLLLDCWEGAALRSRLTRDPAPLNAMLDFYFGAVVAR